MSAKKKISGFLESEKKVLPRKTLILQILNLEARIAIHARPPTPIPTLLLIKPALALALIHFLTTTFRLMRLLGPPPFLRGPNIIHLIITTIRSRPTMAIRLRTTLHHSQQSLTRRAHFLILLILMVMVLILLRLAEVTTQIPKTRDPFWMLFQREAPLQWKLKNSFLQRKAK